MVKIKLKSIRKHSLRSSCSFEKNSVTIEAINNILGKLGVLKIGGRDLKDLVYEEGDRSLDDINKFVDEIYNFRNDDYSVDVILGKDTIFLVINSITDKQKEIYKAVFKFVDFGGEDKNG